MMRKTTKHLIAIALILALFIAQSSMSFAAKTDEPLRASQELSAARNYSTNYTLTGDGPTDMVAIAFAQMGKRGIDFGYKMNWCTNFIGDCAILAGQSAAIPLTLYFEPLEEYILEAGGYEVSLEEAKPGDLCILKNFSYFANHIELVYAADGTTISTIGGNSPTSSFYLYNTVSSRESVTDVHKILRPNYAKLTNIPANVTSNQTTYRHDAEVEITWSSVVNADSYRIDMYCDGRQLLSKNVGSSNSYVFTPDEVGHYNVYITTIRGEEEVRSSPCTFTVAYEAPVVKVKVENEDIHVTWSDVGADHYLACLYDADSKDLLYKEDLGQSFALDLTRDVGNYRICIVAVYPNDMTAEESFDFSILHFAATTNRGNNATFYCGEEVTVSVDAPNGLTCHFKIYCTPEGEDRKFVASAQTYAGHQYTYKLTEAGKYECTIEIRSSYGRTVVEPVTWYTINGCQHAYTAETKAPTCTEQGNTVYTCSLCGDSYSEILPAAGHRYTLEFDEELLSAIYTCTACGHVYVEKCSFGSCTANGDGTHSVSCILCGSSYTEGCMYGNYVDNNNGTHSASCIGCAEGRTEAHSYDSGNCVCGAVEVEEPPTVDETVVIYHSLNLASDIAINYVVSQQQLNGYDSCYMDCVLPVYEGNTLMGTQIQRLQPVLSNGYYYFVLDGLTAVEMNNVVEGRLYMRKDGASYVSNVDSYSIAAYAYNQLNKTSAGDRLKTLCADLLRYGAKAQIYKNYRTRELADGAMTEAHKLYLSDKEAVSFGNNSAEQTDGTEPVVTWVGKTLLLDSRVTVRFVVNTASYPGDISDLSLVLRYTDLEGKQRSVLLTEPVAYSGIEQAYAFDFDGLQAAELRSVLTATVYAGDIRLSNRLTYSADTYGNNKTGTLGELCKALFAYSDSAKQYFIENECEILKQLSVKNGMPYGHKEAG